MHRLRYLFLPLVVFSAMPLVRAQSPVGGMELPDTVEYPSMTVEVWTSIPKGSDLPDKVDLSPWFPPAGNQGRQFSCVSWALCYGLMSYRQNRAEGRTYQPGDAVDSTHTYSPAYLYNFMSGLSRRLYDPPDPKVCKKGTDMDRMISFTMIGGSALLKDMPYDTALASCCQKPGPKAMLSAVRHQIPPPVQVGSFDPDQWRYHLAQGQPILMGIVATSDLRDSGHVAAGERPFTWRFNPRGRALFGHAVVCTGYDNSDSTFTFLNSWGPNWGYHGYFKASLDVLKWKCSGGYVFSNELRADWQKSPGRPADKDTLHGPDVHEELDPGEYQQVNESKVNLAVLGKGDRQAVMQVFHAGTDSLVRSVTMEAGRSYAIYRGGERMELRYKRRSLLGRLLGSSTHFTMRTTPARDEFLIQRNRRIGQLMRDLEAGRSAP